MIKPTIAKMAIFRVHVLVIYIVFYDVIIIIIVDGRAQQNIFTVPHYHVIHII